MCLVTSIFVVLICYAITISAAPPSTPTPYLIPLSISQPDNHTIRLPNITAGLTLPDSCDPIGSHLEKYTMPVRGTRISLDIILCADIPIDRDALQNTLTSAIRIFDAKLAARGDVLMDPDPWFAPEVEGRNCGMAVRSGKEQATLKYQAVSDALIGLFRFYHSTQLYKSSMSIVNDKNQAETQWDVGTIVIGPLQAP